MKDTLTSKEVKQLQDAHRTCKNKKHADRIKTILCLNDGYEYVEISKILLLDDSTLRNYYGYYISGGVEALLTDDYNGGTSYLTCEQIKLLEKHLEENTYLRAKGVCAYIVQTYKVHYTVEGVKVLLHRLGFVYKKTKHIPGKADKKKQKAFIKKYEAIKANKNPEDKIYFMDGCHPLHNSVEAYGWIKKGKEKLLPANTGRERLNLNGAYNIEDHKVIIRNDESINSQSTLSLIKKIMLLQSIGKIYIIADNAKYYRSKIVKMFLKNNKRVKLIFLPAYSPNLNVIERLWLFFKKKRLWNRYYEKFAVFKEECLSFFKNIKLYRGELETLMTDNFHVIQPVPVFSKT